MPKTRKCKHVLKLNSKQKGLCHLVTYLQKFELKEICVIRPNTKQKNTLPSKRFFGKVGYVKKVHKKFYEVQIDRKTIITTACHLKKINNE